jgi:hypothetical protein
MCELILVAVFKWNLYLVCCSSTNRKPSEGMRLVLTTFVGIVFGFFIGISYPTLNTKVQTWNLFYLGISYAWVNLNWFFNVVVELNNGTLIVLTDLQLNISSNLLPSIDVSSIEVEYESGNARSFMKNNSSDSSKYQLLNDTLKVHFFPFFFLRS